MSAECGFGIAWVGRCTNTKPCDDHRSLTCVSCGSIATHQCSETGQFVCGAPLCDNCEHTTAQDGSNGNIGFYRSSPLPEGYNEHCKKSDQVYLPWVDRDLLSLHIPRFANMPLTYV
jgi:hypothetical protein